MWHTAAGDRVLEGAEAQIFAFCTNIMMRREWFRKEFDRFGIPMFDALTSPQRIAMLHQVTQALFRPEVPAPKLTAALEATVAAVLRKIYSLLRAEVVIVPHPHNKTVLRSLVAKACREMVKNDDPDDAPDDDPDDEPDDDSGGRKVPNASCRDMDEWDFCVYELLRDAILWDDDCLSEGNLDLPPRQNNYARKEKHIAPDYFQAVAHNPSEQQVDALCAELDVLCSTVYKTGSAEAAAPRRKASAKKPVAKKLAAKISSVKKATVKKPGAKKPGGAKAVAKKPAAKKKKPGNNKS